MSTGSSAVQGGLWSADPVGWAEHAENRLRPLYEHALARLDLQRGQSLLDAGCGSGLFLALAARHGIHVTGLDAASGLLRYARERIPTADLVVGDLEALPYANGAFDVVTSFNSIPYASDPRGALGELARVTAPDGTTVITMGSGTEQAICATTIDSLAPSDHVPGREAVGLRHPDRLRALIDAAGFAIVDLADVGFACKFADVDQAVRAQLPAGPVEAAVRSAGRDAVERALRAFFAPKAAPDGSVSMRVEFQCVFAKGASA
jgi:SAM-dependent methyltransferase